MAKHGESIYKSLARKTIAVASTEVITYAIELSYMKDGKKNNASLPSL